MHPSHIDLEILNILAIASLSQCLHDLLKLLPDTDLCLEIKEISENQMRMITSFIKEDYYTFEDLNEYMQDLTQLTLNMMELHNASSKGKES